MNENLVPGSIMKIYKALFKSHQTRDVNDVIEIFAKDGHITNREYIIPKEDSVLANTIIHVTTGQTDPRKVMRDYLELTKDRGEETTWIVSLNPTKLTYFWKTKELVKIPLKISKSRKSKSAKGVILDVLTSLLTLINRRAVYNAETFAHQYGEHSLLYFYTLYQLKKRFKDDKNNQLKVVFNEWKRQYEEVYRKRDTTEELFLKHTYLALLIMLVLFVSYFPKDDLKPESIAEMTSQLKKRGVSPFTQDFFSWALDEFDLMKILFYGLKPLRIDGSVEETTMTRFFEADDIFRVIYQQMVSPTTRQALGEFYSPPDLAQMMVEDVYEFGQSVLDPACGSGTFIVEIMRKIRSERNYTEIEQLTALKRVYGFDINPIAVATAKANVLLQLKDLLEDHEDLTINIFLCNSLFPIILNPSKMDLIIGNPPWLVLNKIHSKEYKERVKKLAKDLAITPKPHQQTHLEMCALFLYQVKRYLKDRGRIFFIVSNGVITGDNHAGTRQFIEFDDIHMWKFTQDVFNVHNICLSLKYIQGKTRSIDELRQLSVNTITFHANRLKSGKTLFQPINEEIYIPYDVEAATDQSILVKKFIPENQLKSLLPIGINAYKNKCFQGATVVPRNLVFVNLHLEQRVNDEKFCYIHPMIQYPKKPWDFNPFDKLDIEDMMVERKFIYRVLKSTEVVPFLALEANYAFLPIEVDNETGGYRLTMDRDSHEWKYFEKLNQLYKSEQKKGASIQDLWGRLDYQRYLTAPRQRALVKVVMMGRGALVKACIVRDEDIIIDHANYFIALDSEEEAYFLMAFLNAPCLTKAIQVIQDEGAGGGGRNIHKRPFEFWLPKYNPKNLLHQLVVKQAKRMENKARKIMCDWIVQEKIKLSKKSKTRLTVDQMSDDDIIKPMTIQNRIYSGLGWDTKKDQIKGEYGELDTLVKRLLIDDSGCKHDSDEAEIEISVKDLKF